MSLIDSHAHITSPECLPMADALLNEAESTGLEYVINICTDLDSLTSGIELAKKWPILLNAGSTTPHDVLEEGEALFSHFASAAQNRLLVAIGETGLDYFHHHETKSLQQLFLRRYIALARECRLPLVIHCRDAFPDLFTILQEESSVGLPKGVLHCFTGTIDDAKWLINRGWLISFSGIVTYKKNHELQSIAQILPLESIIIETDTPYLAPQSHRGKPNRPSYLPEIAHFIANLRGISFDLFAEATRKNTKRLFNLDGGLS